MLTQYLAIKSRYGKHLAIKIFIYAFPQWAFDRLKRLPEKIYLMHGILSIEINRGNITGAVMKRHLPVLEYIYSILDTRGCTAAFLEDNSSFYQAAIRGYLDIIKWLYGIYCRLGYLGYLNINIHDIFVGAVNNNRFNIITWLYEHFEINLKKVIGDGDVFYLKAENGRLDVVKYLSDLFINLGRLDGIFADEGDALYYAAFYNRLETVKYLYPIFEKYYCLHGYINELLRLLKSILRYDRWKTASYAFLREKRRELKNKKNVPHMDK
jgi:hypothetical protein